MHLDEQDIQVQRIWCGSEAGTKLVATHALSGITVERLIGFQEEVPHRREITAELERLFASRYPAKDFVLDHIWCGPDKGAALRLKHLPTGIAVDRVVGYDAQSRHKRELLSELFQRLKWHEITSS